MNENDITETTGDFDLKWIYACYENGDSVTSIAAEIGKSEAYVYAKMRRVPEKYEDVKQIREENRNIRVRRVSSLADRNIETYLEDMQDDKEKASDNIDKPNGGGVSRRSGRRSTPPRNAERCVETAPPLQYDRTVIGEDGYVHKGAME